jgi:AraC-like DNA-binding protein
MRDELQRRTEQFAKGELFVTRLEVAIEACLPHGAPTLERLACAMRVSPRQLSGQTRQAGLTVPAAIDQVRRRLAERYLGAALALADISQRLGYSEQSAFTRACVRWFGVSPGKWKPGDAAR